MQEQFGDFSSDRRVLALSPSVELAVITQVCTGVPSQVIRPRVSSIAWQEATVSP